MILKKPYALLIKNFKLIHIILTLLTVFIAYTCNGIVGFFKDFVANNYSVTITDNLARDYISPLLYVAILLSIIILIAVFVLLKAKKKPNKLYLFSIIYYIVLFIFVIIASFLIGGLETSLWETAAARTYRDLSQMIYYPQFVIILLIGVRALGFNVKKFNFKNDLKELEITEADSEEIEVSLNFETYKAERTLRRFVREFKYYLLENKFIIIVISVILLVILGYNIFNNYEKTKYKYKENQSFSYNGLTLNITNSLLTNLDLKGNTIYDDKYFVLVKINIKNGTRQNRELDYNNLKIYYGDTYAYPVLDLGNYFLDFGDPFMGNTIKAGEDSTYIFPYMIDKKDKDKEFEFTIYTGSAVKAKKFKAKTAIVKLKPAESNNVDVIRTARLNQPVSFSSTAIGESSLEIKSAEFMNRYEYNYESCYKDNCRTYTDVVVADNSYQNRQGLIIMDYNLILDNAVSSYKNINNINSFTSAFMEVEYKLGDNLKRAKAIYKTPQKIKDKLIIQTDGYVIDAKEVNLLITIRDRCYVIKLKD